MKSSACMTRSGGWKWLSITTSMTFRPQLLMNVAYLQGIQIFKLQKSYYPRPLLTSWWNTKTFAVSCWCAPPAKYFPIKLLLAMHATTAASFFFVHLRRWYADSNHDSQLRTFVSTQGCIWITLLLTLCTCKSPPLPPTCFNLLCEYVRFILIIDATGISHTRVVYNLSWHVQGWCGPPDSRLCSTTALVRNKILPCSFPKVVDWWFTTLWISKFQISFPKFSW